MVEAAGVEPASEIAVSQEPSCFVRFRMFSPLELRTDKMRQKLVRLISLLPPGPSRSSQPTVRRPLTAHRRSRGRRLLS